MDRRVSELLAQVPDLADHEARRLILWAGNAGPSWMIGDPIVTQTVADRFLAGVERRRRGEPLQYIEGTVQFGPIELLVDRRVLIPRPETERLWEMAAGLVAGQTQPIVVDLCTGSGNLALALKYARPDATVVGCDISPDAVELARENGRRLDLDVEFYIGDLYAALPSGLEGAVDLIVSNPPYVAETDQLPPEVTAHEPLGALYAGADGTAVLSQVAIGAATWLRPGGAIICEIGEAQGNACRGLFARFSPEIHPDLTGRDRFVVGSAPMDSDVH